MGFDFDGKLRAFGRKLGRCPTCMKTSFLAAAAAWLLALGVATQTSSAAGTVVWLAPVAFTMLWIAHLAAFAGRATRGAFQKAQERDRRLGRPAATPTRRSRRRFVLHFARTFAIAAVATSIPLRLQAQSCSCADADCFCPAEYPNCFINPATQESFCCAYGDTGCGSPLLSWCCPNGTNCYGDNGECY
jgi:hypothetical protein